MHIVEILLPADDEFASQRKSLARELAHRFGGLTAFDRAPAKGLFEDDGEQVQDDIVVFQTLVEDLDRSWWADIRKSLERDFRQKEILIQATPVERL